jgi:hypothetical protein
MTFQYRLAPCPACDRTAVIRHPGARCLTCIQATPWYRAMTPAGRQIIVVDFARATLRLTRDADVERERDAALRRLLAPVARRMGETV